MWSFIRFDQRAPALCGDVWGLCVFGSRGLNDHSLRQRPCSCDHMTTPTTTEVLFGSKGPKKKKIFQVAALQKVAWLQYPHDNLIFNFNNLTTMKPNFCATSAKNEEFLGRRTAFCRASGWNSNPVSFPVKINTDKFNNVSSEHANQAVCPCSCSVFDFLDMSRRT